MSEMLTVEEEKLFTEWMRICDKYEGQSNVKLTLKERAVLAKVIETVETLNQRLETYLNSLLLEKANR